MSIVSTALFSFEKLKRCGGELKIDRASMLCGRTCASAVVTLFPICSASLFVIRSINDNGSVSEMERLEAELPEPFLSMRRTLGSRTEKRMFVGEKSGRKTN